MACTTTVHAATYLAEGVDVSGFECNYGTHYEYHATFADTTDRFYDGGKGRDWDAFSDAAYDLYIENKQDIKVFGDLASDITVGSGYLNFNTLEDDSGHCWAYTSSNAIQYWQSYYGVFANKVGETTNAPPVHGYTYDKEYVDTLGGTQSLKLNMLFYENWSGSYGGTTSTAFSWYLGGGQSTNSNLLTGAAGGYFKQYFTDPNATCNVASVWNGAYTLTADEFADSIKTHFGYEKAENGAYELTNKGQILYLELLKSGASHAITCYGFEANESGQITALYVVNSDDADVRLVKLFGKLTDKGYELFTDQLCTVTYNDWRVTGWSSINTPELLKDMLAEYESGKMTWMGREGITWKNSSDTADVNVLPTDETGWMTYAGTGTEHAGYYNTYYAADRGVVFNDAASSGTVNVAEDITISSMEVNNSSLAYTFEGGESTKTITVDEFTRKGSAAVTFNGVDVVAGTATLEGDVTFDNLHVTGALNAAGKTIHADSITLDGDATIGTIGGTNGENATGTTALTITAGTTTIQNSSSWTNLKSLTLSDTAKLNVAASLNVAGNISCGAESLPESGSAEIKTTYCLKVGGDVDLAGNISAGAYIKVAGDAHVTGNVTTTKDYIDIDGTATIGGNLDASKGSVTLNTGGTIGGLIKGSTITLKGDTSANNIADGAAVVVQGGTTSTREVAWTNLKSLEISETARYRSSASVNVEGNISTASTAVGSLPTGTEAGIEATYCIKVGGDVSLAGSMKSGAYVDITGGADITGDLTSTGSTHEHYISIGKDLNLGGNLTAKKQVTIGGNATIGGTTSLSEGLAVAGDLNLKGDSTVAGKVSANNLTLAAGKVLTATGGLSVAGKVSGDAADSKARIETTGTMELGGSVSNIDLQAQSITLIAKEGTATLTNAHLSVAENGVLTLENVIIDSQSLLSGSTGATLDATNVTIVLSADSLSLTQTPVTRESKARTLTSPGPQLELSCSALEGLTITGEGLTFDLSQLSAEDQALLNSAGSVVITFTDEGVDFSEVEEITLTMNDEVYAQADKLPGSDTSFTFTPPSEGTAAIPEPATATLSLLALAALAARRRRR